MTDKNPFWTDDQCRAFHEHNNRVKLCLAACDGIPDAELPKNLKGMLDYLQRKAGVSVDANRVLAIARGAAET